MEVNREVAAEVSKGEVTSTNINKEGEGEEDNIIGRMEGNTKVAPGCRLTTTSNIKMGCMSLNMASKEEASSIFRDQKRTLKTLTHHMRLLQ